MITKEEVFKKLDAIDEHYGDLISTNLIRDFISQTQLNDEKEGYWYCPKEIPLEELKQSIVDRLNKYVKSFYNLKHNTFTYKNNEFELMCYHKGHLDFFINIFLDNDILRLRNNAVEFYLPLDLASDILDYFKRLRSESNE